MSKQPTELINHIASQQPNEYRLISLNHFVTKILPPKGRVLDYGCGAGHLLKHLANFKDVSKVDGLDVDPALIKKSRETNPHLKIYDEEHELPPKSTYDCIYSLDVIEHTPDDQIPVKNMYDLLKPGGQLLIAVPAHQNLFSSFDEQLGHYRRYEQGQLHELLAHNKFEINHSLFWNRLGLSVVAYSLNHRLPRPKTVDLIITPGQKLVNYMLRAWFWLIENRFQPRDGLTIIVVAQKPRGSNPTP